MSAEQLASHDYSYRGAGCDDVRRGPADGYTSVVVSQVKNTRVWSVYGRLADGLSLVPTGKTQPNQRLRHDPTSDVVI